MVKMYYEDRTEKFTLTGDEEGLTALRDAINSKLKLKGHLRIALPMVFPDDAHLLIELQE